MNAVRVHSQLSVETRDDPLGRVPDPWADFRQVERIALSWTQQYNHSLGKYSKFFLELEQERFLATACTACERTYAPPRPLCPRCLAITRWTELSGAGTVETFAVMHFGSGMNEDARGLEAPFVLAYVHLDGADTLFPHVLEAPPERVRRGLRVRVAYRTGPVDHPIHLMHFVPTEDQ